MIGRLLRPIRAGEHRLAYNHPAAREAADVLALHSAGFEHRGAMPTRYAGRGVGDNISPPLSWSGVPDGASELVLIVEDPSAPLPRPFVHAVVRGIPAEEGCLPERALSDPAQVATRGLVVGLTTLRRAEYAGPRPIPGHGPHTYAFQLFAVDRPLELAAPFRRAQILQAMSGTVIARGRLDGIYER
jgi:Raf kinase inhibitor-like YbhB/YbcL family protein